MVTLGPGGRSGGGERDLGDWGPACCARLHTTTACALLGKPCAGSSYRQGRGANAPFPLPPSASPQHTCARSLSPPSVPPAHTSHTSATLAPAAPQVLSWVFSPLLAGFFAIVLFFFTRLIVLRSPRAYERSIYMLPIFVFATFYLCTWFM